jgi:threonine dehydrogenase-like Zn-dependent dehydrogenase
MAGEEGPFIVAGSALAPGTTIGYHRDLPGGWGEMVIAHQSQLFPVADDLDDRTAVLIEPLSIGVHAVLNTPLPEGTQVLIIGSGPIALAPMWALRSTGFTGVIVSQVMRKRERDLARKLGATEVVSPGPEARQSLVDTGALAYQPLVGPEVYAGGGFQVVFDCVGSQGSLEQALRFTSPRGRAVILGCVARMSRLDLTPVWARELGIKGFVGYGREEWRGERMHTFQVTHRLLEEVGQGVGEMVTHVFPLSQYRDALKAAAVLPGKESIKVVLQP